MSWPYCGVQAQRDGITARLVELDGAAVIAVGEDLGPVHLAWA
ncbi:hypothetical protein ABZ746_06745 [Streptomyces sp. NPDC020096]